MKCTKCNDSGVIDTGNNDFPCDCDAGNTAQFNTVLGGSLRTVSGADLRRLLRPELEDKDAL